MKHVSAFMDWLHDLVARGWPGMVAWIGGLTIEKASSAAAFFSYTAGGIWFLVQAYYHIKRKGQR